MPSLYQESKPRFVLARPLAQSFTRALAEKAPSTPIDLGIATIQHEAYLDVLRRNVGEVILVDAADDMPDSCFIEDTVVVVGDQAIIARPGAISRRGETLAVEASLRRLSLRGEQLTIHSLAAGATLDGGDILQLGGHIFVGLSRRTNAAAVYDLATKVKRPVHTIKVEAGLHLKSLLSALDDHTLVIANHPEAFKMADQFLRVLGGDLMIIEVPDAPAANVLRLGRVLVIQAGFEASATVLEEAANERGLTAVKINMSEFIKADGALTCCSVVIP